jgi:cell division protein FtsB
MQNEGNKRKFPFNLKKVGFIVVAIVLFFLVMDLNNRLNELSRFSAQRDEAQQVVDNLEQTLSILNTQIAYATSEGAVEQWAYEEGHMVREGENLIIPLQPAGATQEPLIVLTATPQAISNWDVWLALFLGQ